MTDKTCMECGGPIKVKRKSQALFCSRSCKRVFNNRRMQRGALFYDLFMEVRQNRAEANKLEVWTKMTRLAMYYAEDDARNRSGRPSWMPARLVLSRLPFLSGKRSRAI